MVQQTSLEAYFGHVLPKISERQNVVLMAIIRLQPCTDLEIAQATGLQINQVTPRRGELADVDIVKSIGTKKQNGRPAMVWVCENYEQPKTTAPATNQGELFNNYGK